ncbi:MAG: MATE family efflux transporter [bacterium]|nr:MATE family efflux transporter [bacterium]
MIPNRPPLNLAELRTAWRARSGYREILALAIPLILSTGSGTIQQFIDRIFLCWYSPEAMAATTPAGILSFTLISLFIGTATYAGTFVAQYHGAGRPERASASVWQACYFSLFAGAILFPLAWLAGPLFRLAGHAPAIRGMEETYFKIMCWGGGFLVLNSAIGGFFTGLSRTWTVLWVNLGATLLNIVLDYGLIFGHWGLPRMGVAGAAWATVAAVAAGCLGFGLLFFAPANRRDHGTGRTCAFDGRLFARLMRFGFPNGVQFMLDVFCFALFILLVGRLGPTALGATTLAFQINMVAWMPMIGLGIAASILVGQHIGRRRPDLARRATWLALHLTIFYMTIIALLYVVVPDWFLYPFGVRLQPGEYDRLHDLAVVLLRFVAFYSLFDGMNLVFSFALKGAGDTRFVMFLSLSLGMGMMVLPTWWACRPGGGGIYAAWTFLSIFVIVLALSFLARFRHGAWESMSVIESSLSESARPPDGECAEATR